MGVLEFIAAITGSVAWPLAIVIIVLAFRRHLGQVIPGLQRIRWKDVEVEFGRQLAEVRQELGPAEPAPPALPEAPGPAVPEPTPPSPARYFQSLAEISPRAAILEAWLGFELAANAAVEKFRLVSPAGRPLQMPRLFSVLRDAELLTSSGVDALTRLRALRNQVVHGPEPDLSTEVIAEYASVLKRITDDLQARVNSRLPGQG